MNKGIKTCIEAKMKKKIDKQKENQKIKERTHEINRQAHTPPGMTKSVNAYTDR